MDERRSDRQGLARKIFRKVSGIAGLLRVPSKRHSDSSGSDPTLSKQRSDRGESILLTGITESPQEDQIPALHSADVQLSPVSELQLPAQDSLAVASSEWSQTKSARRKQKRRGNVKQLLPSGADSAAPTLEYTPTLPDTSSSGLSDITIAESADSASAAVASADSASAAADASRLVQPKQRGKRLVPRTASPLGNKRFVSFKGRGSRQGREQWSLHQQNAAAVQPQQDTNQDIIEALSLAKCAVSHARQLNSEVCQVERSQRSGSPALKSPCKAQLDLGLLSRASSDSRLVTQLSSATSLVRVNSAELPQLTEPEMIHKVVKKIKAMYGSCSTGDNGDVMHMLGSIQAALKAYALSEALWLADQPSRVKHAYLCKCFPGTDAKVVHAALHTSKGYVEQAALVLDRKGLTHVPSAFCIKEVFQSIQKLQGVEWVAVWDTCALMRDHWVGFQLLEESRVYQVVPFMTHLELNHIKDDKADSDKAHKGQEAVKMVNAGLQPEYKGRFKLQPEYGEPSNPHEYLPSLTADRDKHIGDDLILQCAAYWDHRAQELSKRMIFFTNDIALSNRAIALGLETSQAAQWLKQQFL